MQGSKWPEAASNLGFDIFFWGWAQSDSHGRVDAEAECDGVAVLNQNMTDLLVALPHYG